MKRPTEINVLGRRVRLAWKPKKAMPDALGLWHAPRSRIDIRRGQIPLEEADTVLHEVMHSILHLQGREYGNEVEETYVRALATGLIPVLRANPEFVAWLTREVNE